MHGHYKDFWVSTGMMLCYVAVLLDAVLLLWGYQVGSGCGALRSSRSRSGRTADDGTLLRGRLALWHMAH